MRIRLLAISLLLLAAACGGADTVPEAPSGTDSPATTSSPAGSDPTTTAPTTGGTVDPMPTPTPQRPATEGPAAPALSTVLADGTEFSLAAEAKPVYLVFWAEW